MRTPESILRQARPTDGIESVVTDFRYPVSRRPLRWSAVAGLAGSAALGLLAFRLAATPAEAAPLVRIDQALSNAPAVIQKEQEFVDGQWRDDGTKFLQMGSKRRYDIVAAGLTRAYDGRRVWTIQRQAGFSSVETMGPEGFGPERYDRLYLSRGGGKILSTSVQRGETILTLSIPTPARQTPNRSLVRFETESGRPLDITLVHRLDGAWRPWHRTVWSYPTEIDAAVFSPKPPTDLEHYDIDANHAQIREGVRRGPTQTVAGIEVRLLGAVQERSGRITVAYSGGTTPLPDAIALAVRDGHAYRGSTLVGSPEAPKSVAAPATKPVPPQPRRSIPIETLADPFGMLDGSPVRVVRFDLPKLAGNPARPIRITLPVVGKGSRRTLRQGDFLFKGKGRPLGSVTFENVVPTPSNMGEELEPIRKRRDAYQMWLAKPTR